MFSSFFNPQNFFWRGFATFTDIVCLSILWLFCSLPLVTLGAATAALYDAVYHGIRREENGTYVRFFRTLKESFKPGALTTLLAAAVGLVLWPLWNVVYYMGTLYPAALALVGGYLLLYFLLLGVWLLSQLLLSRFHFSTRQLMKTAVQLLFAQLPRAAVVILLAAAGIYLCLRVWALALLLPGVWALVVSPLCEKMFAPFLPQEGE